MHYANRIAATLNRPASDRSAGIDHTLVELAATLAADYRLTAEEFRGLLEGTVSESDLSRIVSARLHALVETTLYRTGRGTAPSTGSGDVTSAYEPAAEEEEYEDDGGDGARRRDADERDHADHKKKLAQQIVNRDRGGAPGSEMRRNIAVHKDSLISHLFKVPEDKRQAVVKNTIDKLLAAGTAMTKRQHGDSMGTGRWSVGNNYKPSLPKRTMRGPQTDTASESVEDRYAVIYEHKLVLINELFGGLAKKFGGLFGRGEDEKPAKAEPVKGPAKKTPGKLPYELVDDNRTTGEKIRDDIVGLVKAIEKQQLDLHSQGQLLKGIIQDIINKTKFKVGPTDDKGIRDLVNKYVANAVQKQAGEEEISLTVPYGGKDRDRAKKILAFYIDAIKTIGKPYRTMKNPNLQQVEFIIDNGRADRENTELEAGQLNGQQRKQVRRYAANLLGEVQPGADGAPREDKKLVGLFSTHKGAMMPVFVEMGAHWLIDSKKQWRLIPQRVAADMKAGNTRGKYYTI